MERAPFRNTVDALRFLFNPERATVDRPPMARMIDKHRGEPGPLSGLDGAATAASAAAMLSGRLSPLQLAVLSCRYAPSRLRCHCGSDCCGGWRTNAAWKESIAYVAAEAVYRVMPGREPIDARLVTAVLMREYGKQKTVLTDVGSSLGLSLGTCTNYKRRILDWLLHQPAVPDQRPEGAKPAGIEVQAFAIAEKALRGGGFIE